MNCANRGPQPAARRALGAAGPDALGDISPQSLTPVPPLSDVARRPAG